MTVHEPQTIPIAPPRGISVFKYDSTVDPIARDQPLKARPLGIVRPTSVADVQAIIQWANTADCPVVPISSGPRTGRSGISSITKPALLVDLSSMNRIIHIDAKENAAVIEAGVTFSMLDAVLKPQGLRSFKPLLPRRDKSVIASFIDREPTTSPHDHWDSEDPLGGTQMVFGNGETFRTGTAAVGGAVEDQLKKGARMTMAPGPASTDFLRVVQGSQGTLAIATWASIFCEPIPAREQAFFIGSGELAPLVAIAYKILWRRTGGQIFIVNNVQLGLIGGREPQGCATIADAAPRWVLYVNFACLDFRPDERMAYLVADLIADAEAFGLTPTSTLAGMAAAEVGAQQSELPVGTYKDRLLGGHRAIFFLTQLDRAQRYLDVVTALDGGSGRPVGYYLQPRIQGVSIHFEITLPHDPRDWNSTAATDAFATAAADRLSDAGAFFSRPHGRWAERAFAKDHSLAPYLAETKDMFDPNRIMSPGRLCY